MACRASLFISVMISIIVVIISEFRSDLYVFSPSLYNYDIGGFYEEATVMSELDCARACTGCDTCLTFSYIESTYGCYLYNTWACNQTGTLQTGRQYYKRAEKEQSAPVVIGCGVQRKDILFLLDSSLSVNNGQFGLEKHFVSSTLSYFNLSADKIQVAMVSYNLYIQEAFSLNAFTDTASAQAAALGASRASGSGTAREDIAFQYAFDTVFQPGSGDRADADNVIIFITDDVLTSGYMTQVNRFGTDTEFFVIGVGTRPETSQLEDIASDPVAEHVFEVDVFGSLPAFAPTAYTFACPQCQTCLNQGTCDRNLGRCVCPPGYSGERCEGCLD